MTIKKQALLNMVKSLPSRIDIEDLMYRLYVRKEIELSEQDIKNGRTLSHAQVVREVKKWFR